ncbi:MAG: methyltransferase domain-containing protein [Myxococcota bacterium]
MSDLESHLPSEWWRTLFNALYLKTDGDVVENAENTAAEVDALVAAAGLEPDHRILDLCCGQGRHALELARRGFAQVAGLDRSRALIRLARSRARKEELPVRFHEGDARRFRLPADSFDCVAILGNSFGYFEDGEDDLGVLEAAARVLREGGRLVLDLADGAWLRDHYEPRSWEWIDREQFVCRERSLASDGLRLVSREVVVHAERGVIADQFYAERLYTAASITELLERAGYHGVEVSNGTATRSDRNQDLGMMAHRLIVSARVPRPRPVAKPLVPFPDVTVLLGDPTLPDPVKHGGRFNPEDLETVERMKRALSELPGFRFTYLDRHADLLERLRAAPPAFVLNLCDEGLGNDALRELHVPALLEALGVPYTGAGPACLGLCYDKAFVSAIARTLEVAVPDETLFDPADRGATLPSVFPALVKPVWGDSSIGIPQQAVVRDAEELVERIAALRASLPGVPLLIQEFLTGTEYTVGVIGNPGVAHEVLPLLEVDYDGLDEGLPHILSYESKWDPDSPFWKQIRYVESRAPAELANRMIDAALLLHRRLGCRDYARFDFRLDAAGTPKLLEVNPNPGWCWDGKLNLMAGMAGWSYADLLHRILTAAQERVLAEREERRPAVPDPAAPALAAS